eukprot:927284-Heterocapsa_arctica.AAC.1
MLYNIRVSSRLLGGSGNVIAPPVGVRLQPVSIPRSPTTQKRVSNLENHYPSDRPQTAIKSGPKVFRKCSKSDPTVFQQCSRSGPKVIQQCSKSDPK